MTSVRATEVYVTCVSVDKHSPVLDSVSQPWAREAKNPWVLVSVTLKVSE